MKTIIKITLSIFLGCIVLLISLLLIVDRWKRTNPNLERYDPNRPDYKYLFIKSDIDYPLIYLDINFEYTLKDSISFINKTKLDSVLSFKKEEDRLVCNVSNRDYTKIQIPIPKNDSIPFPSDFYIKFHNRETAELMKNLNYQLFIKHAIPQYMTNESNPLTANVWVLVIDSTLLDLR